MYITFAYPVYLFFLFLIPLLFLIHIVTLESGKRDALKFANFEAIARIRGIDFFSKNITILFLSMFLLFLLVMSVSGLTLHTQLSASSFSFVLVVDSSQSMEADDMFPNRLSVAKEVAMNFVDFSPMTTKFGVVSFSGNSFIEQDLTDNKRNVKSAIENIDVDSFGGTDFYEAVITSTNLLIKEKSRAIILLSDGQINVGSIDKMIKYANDNNIIIYTIAIGTVDGGKTAYGVSKLDEEVLRALSYNTGGEFFQAESKEELLGSFEDVMNIAERKVSINLSDYLIIFVIVLFVFEYFLINTKYRLLP